MNQFLILLGVVLAVLAISYVVLALSLRFRQRRHGGSLTCSSLKIGGEPVAGCVCREKGLEPGSCETPSVEIRGSDSP